MSIPAHVISRAVDDETVLLDLSKGLYFGLGGIGKRIWEAVAEGRNLAQIATDITAEYEVDDERARADVLEFAGKLLARGLFETS